MVVDTVIPRPDAIHQVKVGCDVIFHDEKGEWHKALVTCVHGESTLEHHPHINLVHISDRTFQTDAYGRIIRRQISVPHKNSTSKHIGFWWRFGHEMIGRITVPGRDLAEEPKAIGDLMLGPE